MLSSSKMFSSFRSLWQILCCKRLIINQWNHLINAVSYSVCLMAAKLETKIALKLLQNWVDIALKPHWNSTALSQCTETALKLHWNSTDLSQCTETALLLYHYHVNIQKLTPETETALKLLWNCTETALFWVSALKLLRSSTSTTWTFRNWPFKLLENCTEGTW